ncbi:MAG: SDR family NAD(P)-dependent oxidoreductase [Myxococcales bacterium]|nr:SDR family NAD(P)-dependent oxidoreductase [Myxococcales bacterium]
MKKRFANHVVWITGGGSGIGRALALELAEQGADVAVSGRRQLRLDEVAREIEGRGARGLGVECDVTSEESLAAAVKLVVDSWGRLDVTIANAGFSVAGAIESLSAEDWRRQFDTNVVGSAQTARFALPELRKTKGRMVFVASVASMICTPKLGAYNASKYALRAVGQTLAMELHGSGVSCTTIHPGMVESEITSVNNEGSFDPALKDKRPQNLIWPADKAARVCADAIWLRKREFVFTGHGKLGAFIGRHAPDLVHLAVTRFGKKKR